MMKLIRGFFYKYIKMIFWVFAKYQTLFYILPQALFHLVLLVTMYIICHIAEEDTQV